MKVGVGKKRVKKNNKLATINIWRSDLPQGPFTRLGASREDKEHWFLFPSFIFCTSFPIFLSFIYFPFFILLFYPAQLLYSFFFFFFLVLQIYLLYMYILWAVSLFASLVSLVIVHACLQVRTYQDSCFL